jgi:hypothetical protein
MGVIMETILYNVFLPINTILEVNEIIYKVIDCRKSIQLFNEPIGYIITIEKVIQ